MNHAPTVENPVHNDRRLRWHMGDEQPLAHFNVGAQFIAPAAAPDKNQGAIHRAPTLGEIVRAYKASTTRFIHSTANANFAWQRNYYEHIVCDEQFFDRLRQYILDNPAR